MGKKKIIIKIRFSNFRYSNDESQISDPEFSGFYKYHVPTNTWTCILCDTFYEVKVEDGYLTLKPQTVASRGGHSLLLHSVCFSFVETIKRIERIMKLKFYLIIRK